jgi:hypothetical protein
LKTAEERHIIVLCCEDVPLRGLLADNVYQTLVGIEDPHERKRRIIAAAERQSQAAPSPPQLFIGVPPRIASFTGRAQELDRLDDLQSCPRSRTRGLLLIFDHPPPPPSRTAKAYRCSWAEWRT